MRSKHSLSPFIRWSPSSEESLCHPPSGRAKACPAPIRAPVIVFSSQCGRKGLNPTILLIPSSRPADPGNRQVKGGSQGGEALRPHGASVSSVWRRSDPSASRRFIL